MNFMKPLKSLVIVVGAVIALVGGLIAYASVRTETNIQGLRQIVAAVGREYPSLECGSGVDYTVPPPVAKFFEFVFRKAPRPILYTAMEMEGDFRRPLTEDFHYTTASQTISPGWPALVFDARINIFPGVWARAYDAFIDGRMEMQAKVLSALTVVDEKDVPALNKSSLRRWLLESPLYPVALLPGGPVRWEPIDERQARVVANAYGLEASLIAEFDSDGRLIALMAEEDGDLTTPWHGSGEYVHRDDYQLIQGMMIPMEFTIARASAGEVFPFWKGRIVSIEYIFE